MARSRWYQKSRQGHESHRRPHLSERAIICEFHEMEANASVDDAIGQFAFYDELSRPMLKMRPGGFAEELAQQSATILNFERGRTDPIRGSLRFWLSPRDSQDLGHKAGEEDWREYFHTPEPIYAYG